MSSRAPKATLQHRNITAGVFARRQRGVTLVSVLIITVIIGVMAFGSVDIGHISENAAGNAIQRSRAFQAADGGATLAQESVEQFMRRRVFADNSASEGVFSNGSTQQKWWQNNQYPGEQSVPTGAVLGVFASPRYIIEEIGQYVTDGGSGITSLDLGSSSYGSRSRSGRDVAVYRIQVQGYGSLNEVTSVVETVVGFSF